MIQQIKKGDMVVTKNGIVGKVDEVFDDTVYLTIGPEKIRLEVRKGAITAKKSGS